MQLNKARLIICAIWGGAFAFHFFMFELAPFIRGEWVISPDDAHGGFLKILSLIAPVLTAFGTYWFRLDHKLPTGKVSKERWIAAIVITSAYHLLLGIYLFIVIYLYHYKGTENGVGHAQSSLTELVANVMQVGLVLSPFVVAPVGWLLGVENIEISKSLTEAKVDETEPQ